MRAILFSLLLGLSLPLHAGPTDDASASDPQAVQWLHDMNQAMRSLDYQGRFVYHSGGQMEAMEIHHRVDDGGEWERLTALTGAAREVIKDDDQLRCFTDGEGEHRSSATTNLPGHGFPNQWFTMPDKLTRAYRVKHLGEDRIAARMARLIAIIPVDEYRYGYRIWLDRETSLLLKTDLLTPRGDIVEQLMFTSIVIGGDDRESRPAAGPDGASETTERPAKRDSVWRVNRLPPYFELREVSLRRNGEGPAVEHHLYSDGLAAVSVFFEPEAGEDLLNGASSFGALNAYGQNLGEHHATVVGEVPLRTVKMMAESISRVDNGDD